MCEPGDIGSDGTIWGCCLRAQIPSALANTLEQASHKLGASFNSPCSKYKEGGTGKIVGKDDARSCGYNPPSCVGGTKQD